MGPQLKQSMKAVLAILAGVLLTTGGLSWVEADSNPWHHDHDVYAQTSSEASGKCASACSSAGHSESKIKLEDPGTWLCQCRS